MEKAMSPALMIKSTGRIGSVTNAGVSDTMSPKTIMSGDTLDFKKHLSLQIGQYCQVHKEDTPRKSQVARTKGAISLGPS
jgi:hypothetical protein